MSILSSPGIRDLTRNDFAGGRLSTKGVQGIILVWASWCGACKRFLPAFKDLGAKLRNDKTFSVLAIESEQLSEPILSALGGIKSYPTIKFFDAKGVMIETYIGSRDVNDLLKYICSKYKIQSACQSISSTQSNNSSIIQLKDKDLNDNCHYHAGSTKLCKWFNIRNGQLNAPGIVLFWAKWCKHCQAFLPTYESVATQISAPNNFVVAAIEISDLSTTTLQRLGISSVPTIKYFDKRGWIQIDDTSFDNATDEKTIMQIVCKNYHRCK